MEWLDTADASVSPNRVDINEADSFKTYLRAVPKDVVGRLCSVGRVEEAKAGAVPNIASNEMFN